MQRQEPEPCNGGGGSLEILISPWSQLYFTVRQIQIKSLTSLYTAKNGNTLNLGSAGKTLISFNNRRGLLCCDSRCVIPALQPALIHTFIISLSPSTPRSGCCDNIETWE